MSNRALGPFAVGPRHIKNASRRLRSGLAMSSPSVPLSFAGVTPNGVRYVRSRACPPRVETPEKKEPWACLKKWPWVRLTAAQAEEMDKCWDGTTSTGLMASEFLQAVAIGNEDAEAAQANMAKSKVEVNDVGAGGVSAPVPGIVDLLLISSDEELAPGEAAIRDNLGQRALDATRKKAKQRKRAETSRRNKRAKTSHDRASQWLQKRSKASS